MSEFVDHNADSNSLPDNTEKLSKKSQGECEADWHHPRFYEHGTMYKFPLEKKKTI